MLSAAFAQRALLARGSELCWLPIRMRQSEDEIQAKLDALYGASSSDYLQQDRPKLVGEINSASLFAADARNNLLPTAVESDANLPQLTFVDEARCIGCRSCAEVARSTFRMEDDFGAARVYQQCGDNAEVIEEAVDCCPVDCIHRVSYNELCVLEDHRESMFTSGDMAATQGVGKLSARAEGRDGAPNWRECVHARPTRITTLITRAMPPHPVRASRAPTGCAQAAPRDELRASQSSCARGGCLGGGGDDQVRHHSVRRPPGPAVEARRSGRPRGPGAGVGRARELVP